MYSTNKRLFQIIAIIIFFGSLIIGVVVLGNAKNDVDMVIGVIIMAIGTTLMVVFLKWAND